MMRGCSWITFVPGMTSVGGREKIVLFLLMWELGYATVSLCCYNNVTPLHEDKD